MHTQSMVASFHAMEQDVIPATERASARRNRRGADEGKGWRMNRVRLLFASFCFLFAETGAFAQRVEFVPAGPQVIAESCRFEAPTSADCIAPNGDEALIHFPEALNEAIQEHIEAAKAAGYFDELSLDDLFHGHTLLAAAQTTFATLEDYFSRIRAIVYHSAEYNNRWNQGDRRPRSFVGRVGDVHSVRPAIDLIPKGFPLRGYERSGTVYQDEVGRAHPELSGLKYDLWDGRRRSPSAYASEADAAACSRTWSTSSGCRTITWTSTSVACSLRRTRFWRAESCSARRRN